MTPSQRIQAIDDLIADFEREVGQIEAGLFERLAEAAKRLLDNPAYLATVMRDWNPEWVGLIQSLTSGILDVVELNRQYFTALAVAPTDFSGATSDLLIAVGVTAAGVVIEGGYLATLMGDTSIARQIISAVTDSKLRKATESALVGILRPLVRGRTGDTKSPGVVGKLLDTLTTQPFVEADRVMQQAVGERAELKARLYLGGLIDSSRPFCVARNGKVFLDSEIARFGTSKDVYGGYSDKQSGYFAGKPRTGYDPFTQAGGYKCRHHLNVISNAEAMRRRDDLEEINGVLRIKKD
jgi:hypothetical protein